MGYSPTTWKDGPEGRTPITAAALTKIENGLASASAIADAASAKANAAAPSTLAQQIQQQVQQMLKFIIPIGGIIGFYGTAAPDGWLVCNGQAVSRTTYAELFSVISTRSGAGDGRSTFNLPDLRGQVLYGWGHSQRTPSLGVAVGEFEHTITQNEIPPHTHEIGERDDSTQRYQARTAAQDIGVGKNGYTYLTSTGTNSGPRSPIALASGGQTQMPIFPRGSSTNYIMRAK